MAQNTVGTFSLAGIVRASQYDETTRSSDRGAKRLEARAPVAELFEGRRFAAQAGQLYDSLFAVLDRDGCDLEFIRFVLDGNGCRGLLRERLFLVDGEVNQNLQSGNQNWPNSQRHCFCLCENAINAVTNSYVGCAGFDMDRRGTSSNTRRQDAGDQLRNIVGRRFFGSTARRKISERNFLSSLQQFAQALTRFPSCHSYYLL